MGTVVALVTQYLQETSYGVWIGYHYATLHDQWVWADNTEPQYMNWAPNEPGDVVRTSRTLQLLLSQLHALTSAVTFILTVDVQVMSC